MAYFVVQDFSSGLDVRKSPWTSANGSLQKLTDAHITRGGEIEKRKALGEVGTLPTATSALVSGKQAGSDTNGLIVFGSGPPPGGLPDGVAYQQIQHPDGAGFDLVDIADATLFDGRAYVVGEYSDGSQWHFYNGALVKEWGAGVVRSSMVTNDLIAEHMRGLIDGESGYTATRTGATVIVSGPTGSNYAVSTESQDGGGNPNQNIVASELVAASVAAPGTQAVGEFAILIGEQGAGNYIDKVRVDVGGVFTELISSTVPFNTTPELTALDVVTAINAGTSVHGYNASTKYGKIFIGAPASLGASANGRIVEVVAKGSVCLYNGKFSLYGGPAGAGNEVATVFINGVVVTSAAIPWATSDAATAAAVAANINAYASVPKINAVALGSTVYLSPEKIRSNDATSLTLIVNTNGNVTATTGSNAPVENDYTGYTNPQRPGFDDVIVQTPEGGVQP